MECAWNFGECRGRAEVEHTLPRSDQFCPSGGAGEVGVVLPTLVSNGGHERLCPRRAGRAIGKGKERWRVDLGWWRSFGCGGF